MDFESDGALERYLPDQSGRRGEVYKATAEQKVPEPPRWMDQAQREAFYRKDIEDAFGAEYIADSIEEQGYWQATRIKRSSRPQLSGDIPLPFFGCRDLHPNTSCDTGSLDLSGCPEPST